METGTISNYNEEKCFGFIKDDNSSQDFFMHGSDVLYKDIEAGQKVQFEIGEYKRGFKAIKVVKLES